MEQRGAGHGGEMMWTEDVFGEAKHEEPHRSKQVFIVGLGRQKGSSVRCSPAEDMCMMDGATTEKENGFGVEGRRRQGAVGQPGGVQMRSGEAVGRASL